MEDEEMVAKIQSALALQDGGRIHEAISAFQALVASTEDNSLKATLLTNESTCYSNSGDVESARRALQLAKSLPGINEGALLSIALQEGCIANVMGDRKEATKVFQEALQRYPLARMEEPLLYHLVLQQLAVGALNADNYSEALEYSSRSLREDPPAEQKAESLYYAGISKMRLNRYPEAKLQLEEALDLGLQDPLYVGAHSHLAVVAMSDNDFRKALDQLELCEERVGVGGLPDDIKKLFSRVHRALGNAQAVVFYERPRSQRGN